MGGGVISVTTMNLGYFFRTIDGYNVIMSDVVYENMVLYYKYPNSQPHATSEEEHAPS